MRRADLDATFVHRLTALLRPQWARTVLARRIAAGGLALAAVISLLRGDPDADAVEVVALRHDVAPGEVITTDDLALVDHPAGALPDGALHSPDDAVGRTVAAPRRAGEVLTDLAVLGPRLTAAAAGTPDARVVPIRLADPQVAELLREGDRVDVLTADDDSRTTLATDAAVILVSTPDTSGRATDRVVLLALSGADAKSVAGASLTNALAVVLH